MTTPRPGSAFDERSRSPDRPATFTVPEREPPPPPVADRAETPEPEPKRYTTRRRLLKWTIRAGYGAFALAFALPALALRALSTPRAAVAEGDRLVFAITGELGNVGEPLRADALEPGTGVQAYPENKTDNQSNLIEVVRIAPGEGAEGLVAYSAICTHLGCAVYARLNQEGLIACPCHNSRFDPADDAAVIGGPANRPLPSLPITVDAEGIVVVAGPFEGPVGPE